MNVVPVGDHVVIINADKVKMTVLSVVIVERVRFKGETKWAVVG